LKLFCEVVTEHVLRNGKKKSVVALQSGDDEFAFPPLSAANARLTFEKGVAKGNRTITNRYLLCSSVHIAQPVQSGRLGMVEAVTGWLGEKALTDSRVQS